MTAKVKTFHFGISVLGESATSAAFYYSSDLLRLLPAFYPLRSRSEQNLSNWHSAPLQHITPILNVKQIWHGALIVNNLAQAMGSANRRASTFSSYQGLLFFQLPRCLYLRQVSSYQCETPSFLIQLSPWLGNLTYNIAGRHSNASWNTPCLCENTVTWMII